MACATTAGGKRDHAIAVAEMHALQILIRLLPGGLTPRISREGCAACASRMSSVASVCSAASADWKDAS